MPQFAIIPIPCQLLLLRISATRSYNKHFTLSHALPSSRLLAKLRRNGIRATAEGRLSKFFRRFIFAEERFASIEGRKNSPRRQRLFLLCDFSPLSGKSRGTFRRKTSPFRRLKLPKRAREKRIFRHLRNLTTVKSEASDKD